MESADLDQLEGSAPKSQQQSRTRNCTAFARDGPAYIMMLRQINIMRRIFWSEYHWGCVMEVMECAGAAYVRWAAGCAEYHKDPWYP